MIARKRTYKRLMEAEQALWKTHLSRGLGIPEIDAVREDVESPGDEIEPEDDLYLTVLARYVASLGGHVEVRAVFPEATITVLRDPDPGTAAE